MANTKVFSYVSFSLGTNDPPTASFLLSYWYLCAVFLSQYFTHNLLHHANWKYMCDMSFSSTDGSLYFPLVI